LLVIIGFLTWGRTKFGCEFEGLTGRVFWCSPEHIRRAAFLFAQTKVIIKPLDKDKMCAGKDWFSGFLKRNGDFALKKLQVY